MGSPILIRRVWDRSNKYFAGVIRIRGGDPGLSGDTPRATAQFKTYFKGFLIQILGKILSVVDVFPFFINIKL